MKLITYALRIGDFEDRLSVTFGATPTFANSIKGLDGAIGGVCLERAEEMDGSIEQIDGMPSYPKAYRDSLSGSYYAVCNRG